MAEETIFHRIINKEIPADIVYEDERVLAFRDIAPVAPTHILLIPKKTLVSLKHAQPEDESLLGYMLLKIKEIAAEQGLDESGYRLVVNTGAGGGQTVFQLHMHLIAGRDLEWPPG